MCFHLTADEADMFLFGPQIKTYRHRPGLGFPKINIKKEGVATAKTGGIVKETIEETREELKDLRKQRSDYKS